MLTGIDLWPKRQRLEDAPEKYGSSEYFSDNAAKYSPGGSMMERPVYLNELIRKQHSEPEKCEEMQYNGCKNTAKMTLILLKNLAEMTFLE